MRKLDWYIIKKFLGTFFLSITLILLIVVIFDISETQRDIVDMLSFVKVPRSIFKSLKNGLKS